MLSREAKQYIELMREEQYETDSDSHEHEGWQFIGGIAQNVALFFNHTIHSINLLKNSKNYSHPPNQDPEPKEERKKTVKQASKPDQIATDHLESNAESTQRRESRECEIQEVQEMKELDQIYKEKEDKLENLPKKPVSSFFMYYQDHSKEFTAQVGQVGGSRLAQIVADTWKKLPLQVKQPYFDRANADKQRYRDEIAVYIQQHTSEIEDMKLLNRLKRIRMKKFGHKNEKEGQDKEDDELDSEQVPIKIKGISQRQMKAADRKNYSHRPKAPVSSFFIFYQEEAKNIAQKYGQTVGSKIARLASSLWKGMSNQAKQKYEEAAKIERERYHQEMIQYKIDYPNEIQSRRKKISNSMKRALKMDSQLRKQEERVENSDDSLPNLQEDNSSDSDQSHSSNSYVSQEEEVKKVEVQHVKAPIKREKKEKEDPMPHKPKGPICSFFQYYHANIQEFMKKEGDNNKDAGSQFVRRASIKWKSLNEKEKQVYHEMARVDRDRYQKEMNFFKQTYPSEYEILLEFNKNKQLKNKNKRLAKMQNVKEEDIDDIELE